jgi:uncharacterized protein YggU (UPF0235/DUF167 family)
VRLTPRAGRDQVTGIETFGGEAALTARVRALPEAGRANAALEKLIAAWLDVPRPSVRVAHGGKSRMKRVTIEGDPDALVAAITSRLGEIRLSS